MIKPALEHLHAACNLADIRNTRVVLPTEEVREMLDALTSERRVQPPIEDIGKALKETGAGMPEEVRRKMRGDKAMRDKTEALELLQLHVDGYWVDITHLREAMATIRAALTKRRPIPEPEQDK